LRARAHEARFDSMRELREAAKAEIRKVVVGQDVAVDLFLVAALAHGHVLVEGPPGSAKTLLARAMAHVLGSSFKRIQFTPDTTPTHIIGEQMLKAGEQVFLPGPIFANVVLADEINRTPPRTQAALLEAMQERHVTVDGRTHRLPDPFLVIATQNPFEHEGIFSLPESQLDRFLFKIDLDYCDPQSELEMLTLPHLGIAPDMLGEIRPLLGVAGLDRARMEIDSTETPEPVLRYIIGIVRATREQPGVQLGASSRAAIHLLAASKAHARIVGRSVISADDVRVIAPYVLRHRLIVDGTTADTVLRAALSATPAPAQVRSSSGSRARP
jgi:MoxR-like ATPase